MPKLDKKKATLEELKTWRNYAVTSLLALIAFVFTKYNEIGFILSVVVIFVVALLGVGVLVVQLKINKTIKEIGDL